MITDKFLGLVGIVGAILVALAIVGGITAHAIITVNREAEFRQNCLASGKTVLAETPVGSTSVWLVCR